MRLFTRSGAAPDMIGDTPPSWHLHRYLQGSANLFEENRLLKFAIAGLFGVSAVLGTVIYTSNQNQRTVIVPFGAGGDLYVTGNAPSATYLRAITRNIVGLVGTYSAYSDERQFQERLSLVHPSAYNGLRDSLSRLVDELGTNPTLSIATYIRVIGGVIRKFRGNLRIRFVVDNGRFWLTALQEEKFSADIR